MNKVKDKKPVDYNLEEFEELEIERNMKTKERIKISKKTFILLSFSLALIISIFLIIWFM